MTFTKKMELILPELAVSLILGLSAGVRGGTEDVDRQMPGRQAEKPEKNAGKERPGRAHEHDLELLEGTRSGNRKQVADALARGEIDAFSAWEPTPTIALARSDGLVSIHRTISTSYLYLARRLVEKHPEAVRLIVASQLRGMTWMQQRRQNLLDACRWTLQAGSDLSGEEPILSEEHYAQLTQRDILNIRAAPMLSKSDLINGGSLHREFEFIKTLNKIPHTSSWNDAYNSFDTAIIREVTANTERYRLSKYDYSINGGNND